MPFQSTPVGSSALGVLPPNLAVCLRVGVWDKTWSNAENFSASKARSFIFVPRTKQVRLQVADILAEDVNSLFQPLFTYFEEGIITSGFISARFSRSEAVCCDHDWKNRCWRLGIESRHVLFQILLKECLQLSKRNDVHLIVKVGVAGTRDNEQFLVVPRKLAVRSFAEIAGVCLLAMH